MVMVTTGQSERIKLQSPSVNFTTDVFCLFFIYFLFVKHESHHNTPSSTDVTDSGLKPYPSAF